MANAMVDSRPTIRFYCHRCNIEFEDTLQDYTCPYCSSGFIEEVESSRNNVNNSGPTFRDARISPFNVVANTVEASLLNPVTGERHPFPVNNIPPVLQDIAFLMTGSRLRRLTGRQGGAGPPVVLVGAPGDYVFGGEALDAVVTQLLGQLEHTGPPPLPRDVLNSIPSETVTEEHAAANNSCSVCWENFQTGETISRLECEHIFHSSCITPWLQLHATCPICRRSLLPPEAEAAAAAAAANANANPNPNTANTETTANTNTNINTSANTNTDGNTDTDNTTTTTSTSTSTSSSTTNTSNTSNTSNGPAHRLPMATRLVIRRSSHPLFRRSYLTHAWNSPRNASASSESSSSVSAGRWAPHSRADPATAPPGAPPADRTGHNHYTDFDCD